MSERATVDLVTALNSALGWVMRAPHEIDLLTEVRDRLVELDAAVTERNESANRWAHKATLLVLWIKTNCTPDEQAAARAASQVPA